MNNLLRSLRGSLELDSPDAHLKTLFSHVREARSQDVKVSDSFYDALEGLLAELRTVTMDNRDAEAFLKPVSRQEVPDYFDVIAHPMDFQTMLKKVKAKGYKSKLEFSDDLDLIWENCYRYNSTPDHPLRACASRLREKANVLLRRITDRVERQAPRGQFAPNGFLPSPPSSNDDHGESRPMVNGKPKLVVGGKAITKSRPKDRPSLPIKIPPLAPSRSQSAQRSSLPAFSKQSSATPSGAHSPSQLASSSSGTIPFEERAAILRTQQSMENFLELDRQLDELFDLFSTPEASAVASTSSSSLPMEANLKHRASILNQQLTKRLRTLTDAEVEREKDYAFPFSRTSILDSGIGYQRERSSSISLKRKRSMSPPDNTNNNEDPLRKRIKSESVEPAIFSDSLLTSTTVPSVDPLEAVLDLWWQAMGTNTMIASGVPGIVQPVPLGDEQVQRRREGGKGTGKRKRTKQRAKVKIKKNEHALNTLMNNNIATLRKLRATHARYSQLTKDSDQQKEGADGGDGGGGGGASSFFPQAAAEIPELDKPAIQMNDAALRAREKPWKVRGKGDIGAQEAAECYEWMCGKVLEHATFQGSSTLALQQLTEIAVDYISNVGKTMRLLLDQYSHKMNAEEIILHTLFENGVPSVSDLEMYIKDDIIRHGVRLQDTEKKLNSALQEILNTEAVDDDAVFGEDADEDNFSSNMFGDLLGEDYLGLEASGILSEIGLPSLTIPKRLWKGKKGGAEGLGKNQETREPQLPYPPPPPFVPLLSTKVDNQIGLIQDYFRDRFTTLTTPTTHPLEPTPTTPVMGLLPIPTIAVQPPGTPTSLLSHIPPMPTAPSMLAPPVPYPQFAPISTEPLVLPDDTPDTAHTKIGPLGQILVTNPNASLPKKKAKKDSHSGDKSNAKAPSNSGGGGSTANKKPAATAASTPKDPAATGSDTPTPSPKKKKASANPNNTTAKKTVSSAGGGGGGGGPKQPNKVTAKHNAPNGPTLVPPV